jgi:hypothetical protein
MDCRLTSVGVELRVVQGSKNLLDGLDSSIPSDLLAPPVCASGTHCAGRNIHLEVSSNKELASHDCGIGLIGE